MPPKCPICGGTGEQGNRSWSEEEASVVDDIRPCEACGGTGYDSLDNDGGKGDAELLQHADGAPVLDEQVA